VVATPGEEPVPTGALERQGEVAGDAADGETLALRTPPASPQSSGTQRLSWSRLSSYQRCGESFRLSYVEQVPKLPSGAALAGQATHRVGEQLAKDGTYSDPFYVEAVATVAGVQLFTELVEEAGGPDACQWGGRKRNLKDERTGRDIVDPETGEKVKVGENFDWMCTAIPTWIKRMATILRRDAEAGLYIVEANVEREVVVWLIPPGFDAKHWDGVQVHGYIDTLLLATDEGLPVIRDWKTGTMLEHMQLAVYAWLLEQLPEPLRVRTTVGQFGYLRGSKAEDWIKTHDLTALKPLVSQMFMSMLRGMKAEVYPLSPSSFCSSCWVRESCVYGKTLEPRKGG
jgi:PD-(D/E)XK nuclease superfamily